MRPENTKKAIDNLGRITIPKGMRDRMGLDAGTNMEFFTTEIGGREFVCMAAEVEVGAEVEAAKVLLEMNGYKVSKE